MTGIELYKRIGANLETKSTLIILYKSQATSNKTHPPCIMACAKCSRPDKPVVDKDSKLLRIKSKNLRNINRQPQEVTSNIKNLCNNTG